MPTQLELGHKPACEVLAGSVHIQEQDYLFAYAIMAVYKVGNPLKMMEDCKVASKTYPRKCLGIPSTLHDDDRTFLRFIIEHADKTTQPFNGLIVIDFIVVAHGPANLWRLSDLIFFLMA